MFHCLHVSKWVNRKRVDGRVVIGISKHKSATIATLVLTQEEEAVSSLAAKFAYH